jgi:hypothetical protein
MAFSKTFPRTIKGSPYARWVEIGLTEEEEKEEEERAIQENLSVMRGSLLGAERLVKELGLKKYQNDLVSIAIALFEKRASHSIYYKENRAKMKFDKLFSKE